MFRPGKLWICAGLALATPASVARADETPTAEQKAAAQQHFARSKELYLSGSYKEALAELEAARALDPQAKDLAFNLGVVNERLGRLDDAIKWFRLYVDMPDTTPAERGRAEVYVKRIEGAKRDTPPPVATVTQPQQPQQPRREEPPPKGRIDALTIGSGAVALGGFAIGTVFAIKAVGDKPKSGFVTGRDGSYGDLQQRADDSHREAIVADIGFGVGVVFTVLTAYLYFSRPKLVSVSPSSARVSVAKVPGGSGLVLSGSF